MDSARMFYIPTRREGELLRCRAKGSRPGPHPGLSSSKRGRYIKIKGARFLDESAEPRPRSTAQTVVLRKGDNVRKRGVGASACQTVVNSPPRPSSSGRAQSSFAHARHPLSLSVCGALLVHARPLLWASSEGFGKPRCDSFGRTAEEGDSRGKRASRTLTRGRSPDKQPVCCCRGNGVTRGKFTVRRPRKSKVRKASA